MKHAFERAYFCGAEARDGSRAICADQFEQTTYISKSEFPTRGETSEGLRTRAAALRLNCSVASAYPRTAFFEVRLELPTLCLEVA